ncbi:MAG: phosphoribosylglycinamide formyltransferase, partial [Thermoplasmata archaeon]
MTRLLPIAVLVSGEGTTLDALAEMAAGAHLPIRVVLVVADRPHAPAIERARRRGLPTIVLPSHGPDAGSWSRRLTEELESRGAELIVNAGFFSILPDAWVDRWHGRAINLHPSLLPRYGGRGMYGARVLAAVIAAGERESGATVHLVTREIDAGPTIAQAPVPVLPGDTPEILRERMRPVEIDLLARTLRRFAEGALPLPYFAADGPAAER